MSELKKEFKDSNGKSVTVHDERDGVNGKGGIIVAELMGKGYVIAFWKRDKSEENGFRLEPVGSRIEDEDIEAETIIEALRWGDKLASVLVEAL